MNENFIHVRRTCNSIRSEIGCASSAEGNAPNVAQLELNLEAGEQYFIFIDSPGDENNWMLNMRQGECPRDPGPDPDRARDCL